MISKNFLILLAVLASALNIHAAPHRGQLVRFHPISRAQYNAILGLTEGKPVISEARLISSGLNRFNELRTLLTDDINSGWHQLLNFTGLQDDEHKISEAKDKVEGYPLCVIKTEDLEKVEYDDDDVRLIEMGKSENENDNHTDKDDKSEETYNHKNRDRRPVINCVVVMQSKDKDVDREHGHDHDDHDHHQHNNDRPPKRRRNKYSNVYDNIPYGFNAYGRFEKPQSSSSSSTRMSLRGKSKSKKTRDYSQLSYQQLLNNYNEEQEQLLPSYFGAGNPYAAYNYQYNSNAYNPYANFYDSSSSYGNPYYGSPSVAAAASAANLQYQGNARYSEENSHSDEEY